MIITDEEIGNLGVFREAQNSWERGIPAAQKRDMQKKYFTGQNLGEFHCPPK